MQLLPFSNFEMPQALIGVDKCENKSMAEIQK
jgi:hypothetical protein